MLVIRYYILNINFYIMKTTNKLLVAWAIAMLSFSFSYADNSASGCTLSWSTNSWSWMMSKKEFKKSCNEAIKQNLKEQKETTKQNLKDFKNEYWSLKDYLSWANEEQKQEFKDLKDSYLSWISLLKDEYKQLIASWTTLEEKQTLRDELQEKLQQAWEDYFTKMLEIAWDNADLKAYVEARKEVFENNSEVRSQNLAQRQELRTEKKDSLLQYKENFINKIWNTVDAIATSNPDKLTEISTKIDTLIAKYEASTKLSTTQKEKIIAQLNALKQVISEALDTQSLLDETTTD